MAESTSMRMSSADERCATHSLEAIMLWFRQRQDLKLFQDISISANLATFIASNLSLSSTLSICHVKLCDGTYRKSSPKFTTVHIHQVTDIFSRFPAWTNLRVINILKCLSTSTFHRWLLAMVPFSTIETLVAGPGFFL
ncbi:hypothetical protein HGRIS_006153 [Hohenbuehelia grisea]|uniref:Uncharacterized protein n=1 Tax=Hohenbuehelia grisea TaxID=104357 RepID=A0ABR3K1Q9_9AGAR